MYMLQPLRICMSLAFLLQLVGLDLSFESGPAFFCYSNTRQTACPLFHWQVTAGLEWHDTGA